jgi:hypothetical protein
MASALTSTFLERYHKYSDGFPNHIGRLPDDGTWVSFVNGQTKEQSAVKAADTRTFTKQAEKD